LKNRRIIFRADGDSKIGLGHVMRCVALGQMLTQDFELHFAIQKPSEAIKTILQNESFIVHELSETPHFEKNIKELQKIIDKNDIVVLDGYNFKLTYQKSIRSSCRKLVFIDDLAAWHQVADLVINHNGIAQRQDYSAENYTQFCLGTDYALLRKEFLKRPTKAIVPNRYEKFLVNFGGADPLNMTYKVCEILLSQNLATKRKITVIVGPSYPFIDKLKKLDQDGKLTIVSNLPATQMADTIEQHQVVICSCSTIAYEVATLKRSLILIQTADNQSGIASFFQKEKMALDVFRFELGFSFFGTLMKHISFKRETVANQAKFFDGQSGERLREFFIEL
jgi:UDP-2,4-diacetamido-2,4,6-trideoxy-beta-L-altropyranose hydrolase